MDTETKSIPELTKALVRAQSAMEPAVKDRTNPAFRSKYADLSSVIEAVRKPLADNGLAFVQFVSSDADGLSVVTRLLHVSGESLESPRCWMPVVQKTPQGYGSAATYAKRYALAALLGVATEDDDGHDASRAPRSPETRTAPKPVDTTKLVAAFAGIGIAAARLESHIGKPLADATEQDVQNLRQFHKEKKAAATETPEAVAKRIEAEKAEAGIAAETAKARATIDAQAVTTGRPAKDPRFIAFEDIVTRIRAAVSTKEVTLVQAEAASQKLFTPGDLKALQRSAADRSLILEDAARKRPAPSTEAPGEIPF